MKGKKIRKGKLMKWVYDCPFCESSDEVYTDRQDEGCLELSCESCEKAWVIEPKYFFKKEVNYGS